MSRRELRDWPTIQSRQDSDQDTGGKPSLIKGGLAEGRKGTIGLIARFAGALVVGITVGTRTFAMLMRRLIAMRMARVGIACVRRPFARMSVMAATPQPDVEE